MCIRDRYVEMVNYLTPFEKTYPKDWTILYYLGKGNNKLQKREIAKTYFKKVLGSQENYLVDQIGQANFELGKISLYENNYKDSIVQLVQASQRLPNDSNVRFYLASAYFKNEDYEKSIEIYQQMLLKDQNDPKIRIYLGMAYFELGQYQSAEKNFQLVLNQGSNEPLLFYYLAKVEDQKGNLPYEDAVLDFSNPETVNWYQQKIGGLLDQGVGVIKVDFGEAAPANGIFHSGRTGFYEHNLYPLRYNKTVAEITKQKTGEKIIWARSTWAGSQRYPLHLSLIQI